VTVAIALNERENGSVQSERTSELATFQGHPQPLRRDSEILKSVAPRLGRQHRLDSVQADGSLFQMDKIVKRDHATIGGVRRFSEVSRVRTDM
jgi:hypothetical protein